MKRTACAAVLAATVAVSVEVGVAARATPPGLAAASAPPVVAEEPRVLDITRRVDRRRRGLGAFADTWGDSLVIRKNRDRHPDVLLTFHLQPWEIWLGTRNGRFVFDRALPRTDRHNCAAADFGGPGGRGPDGRTDLYCVRGAFRGTISDKENELLIQRRNGGFRNVAGRWGVADPSGRGRTVSVLDIRGNGRPSLFVGNAKPEEHPSKDHIYVNRGRRFVQAHTGGLPSVQNTSCSDTGDFDRDGRQDFVTCSRSLRLYENRTTPGEPVSYRQVASDQGLPDRSWRDAELVDLDGDGWRDLVLLSAGVLQVRLNTQAAPHFSQVDYRRPLVAGASFCTGRANGDDALDLLVVQKLESASDRIQKRDWMLVNAGTGDEFAALAVPQPPKRNGRNGNGDTCTAVPRYRGERAAWTISNGRMTAVPIAYRPGYRQLVVLQR